jgi:hypothetical protein
MELIKFDYVAGVPDLTKGVSVADQTKSKLWVERYRDAGEFEVVAEPESGLRTTMPIGACISHIDTDEVMIVENHQIAENADGDSELTVSGRSLETVLEQRVVGQNQALTAATGYSYPTANTVGLVRLYLVSNMSYSQAKLLINNHASTNALNANDVVPILKAYTALSDSWTAAERDLDRDEVYSQLLDILAVNDLGIKVVRPGVRNPLTNPDNLTKAALVIHKGIDLSSTVTFSHDNGDIESAEYLWSNKANKTSILVKGKWLEIVIDGSETGYSRRNTVLDVSFLDEQYSAIPTAGTVRDDIYARMVTLGNAALARMNDVAITKVEISDQRDGWTYRKDFNIGDIIAVQGNYNATANMRVTEYVEMEDESGAKSYPTLAFL